MPRRKTIVAEAEIIPIGGAVPTNGAEEIISFSEPYIAEVTIEGSRDLLFHGWNVEAIEEKATAAKGSKSKKTDNLESYVYRDEYGVIGIPGNYLHAAIKHVGRYRQDPRSPRKSARDLFKEAIIMHTEVAPLGIKRWDYEHRARVVVQRNAITRTWPAIKRGWQATFRLEVILPEYVSPDVLNEVIAMAGRIAGIGDWRPTYGRFNIVSFKVIDLQT